MGATDNTQNIETEQLTKAMEQVARKQNRGKVTRRVLLGAVGVGACAGAVALAPIAVEKAGYYTKQELDQAIQNGIAQGRKDLLAELKSLEGVGLDTAVAVAKVTRFAVQYIVKPLLDLNSTVQGDIFLILANGVASAQSILGGIPFVPSSAIAALNNVQALLRTWHENESNEKLGQYAVEDVTAAETYLEALQKKVNGQSS
ncbi:MAG: hypothetical protein ACLQUY_26315 [Ktedonobacterales bacterium]